MATQPNTSISSGRQEESAAILRQPQPRRKLGQPASTHDTARQQRAIALKISGLTYAAISKQLGVTRQRVQQLVKPSIQTVLAVKARAGNCCEKCGVAIPIYEGHIHHISGQEDYNALENLLYVCIPCHREEHTSERFNALPPGPERRANSEAFAQPYLEHIKERFCLACGKHGAKRGLCKGCVRKNFAISQAKARLGSWLRGDSQTSYHQLSQAIYTIRKNNLKPEDFGPRTA